MNTAVDPVLVPEKACFDINVYNIHHRPYYRRNIGECKIFQNNLQTNMNYDDFLVEGPVMELFKLFPQSYKPLDLYGDGLSLNSAF